jgi:hypothetical protein
VAEQVEEYAIEWTSPSEHKGSFTILGTGQFNRDKGFMYLDMYGRLPGEMRGKIVSRTITWSSWREEKQDGSIEYLPRVTRFREIHPGI